MPYPTYQDSAGLTRSVRTASASAAGTNGDPDVNASVQIPQTDAFVLHRDLTIPGANLPTTPALADVAAGGSLLFNTSYKVAFVPRTDSFVNSASSVATIVTAIDAANTHRVRATITQVPGATSYMLFCSTAASPTWLADVTEAQRVAAGCRITAIGVVDNLGDNPAGTVDVLVAATANSWPVSAATIIFMSPDVLNTVYPFVSEDVLTGGTLAPNTAYAWSICATTRLGIARATPAIAVTTANDGNSTHCVRCTIPQTPDADQYLIFLFAGSAGSSPTMVGNVTEAQRAAGGFRFTAMGLLEAGGPNPPGTIDVCIVGTGSPITATPYLGTSVSPPSYVPSRVVPFDCAGFSKLRIVFSVFGSDLRTISSFALSLCEQIPISPDDWFSSASFIAIPMSALALLGASAVNSSLSVATIPAPTSGSGVVLIQVLGGINLRYRIWVQPYN